MDSSLGRPPWVGFDADSSRGHSGRISRDGGIATPHLHVADEVEPIDTSRLRPAKSEVQRLLSDNTLAADRLGWRPQVSLREGLARTIDWVAEHLDLYRPEEYQV